MVSIKKIIFILAASALMFVFRLEAFAAGYAGAATINADGVNLRAEASTESKKLAVMNSDAAIDVIERAGDWYKIVYNGFTGYVFGVYADVPDVEEIFEDEAPLAYAAAARGVINADNVNMRADSGMDYGIIAILSKGTEVAVHDSSGEWYRVTANGQTGFVYGPYVNLTDDLNPEPGVVNDHNVNLRAESNTVSAILAKMAKGERLTVLDRSGDWFKVEYGDHSGYVLGVYITLAESLETINDVGMINANGVNLRADNSTGSAVLATLGLYTPLSVIDKADDWYKVKTGDKTGYVSAAYVTLGESPIQAAAPASLVFDGGGKAELVDWSEGRNIMLPGTRAIVTDVATGISFEIKVLANGNHADVEPLTANDTASILQIRGSYSWTPRAIRVTVNGRTIAASCNGMPHDVSTIKDNDFPGHFCIHFFNSRNHYNGAVDAGQQKQVQIAFGS